MAAILGAALTRFSTDQDPQRLVHTVTQRALHDARIHPDDVDAIVVANAAAEGFTDIGNVSVWTATHAGLAGTPTLRVDTGPSSGLAALWTAQSLTKDPGIEHVLALGWETMTTLPTDEATRVLARLMAPDEQALHLSLPGLVGLLASAYLDRHDIDPRVLDHAAHKAHRLAANNPLAQFQDPVTLDQIQASPRIADPLRLLHCAPLTDGAAACVIGPEGPVEIQATGHATDALGLTQRRTPPDRFHATRDAARQAFEHASFGPEEVDVVELHDAFTVLEPVNLEDLGFAEPGHGPQLVPTPEEDPLEAELVVNPSGGLKARGHPVGATGLAQTAECFFQIQGRAANQAPRVQRALVHSIGGFGNNVHVALLEEASS